MDEGSATRSRTSARARSWPRSGPGLRLLWLASDLRNTLSDTLEGELTERAGFHWLAVAFGAGAAIYFVLPREPLLSALLVAASGFALAAVVLYWRGASVRVVAVVAVLLAGLTAAKLRIETLHARPVERPFVAEITGRVIGREDRVELRPRIVLDRLSTDAEWAERLLPPRVRLTLADRYDLPPLGAMITFRARIMPVPGPIVRGGYDPRGAAFFKGIGAGGFVFGNWQMVEPSRIEADLAVDALRAAIVERIDTVLPGEAGAVAAALLVGERSGISTETKEDLRAAGLAHVLAISGMHMMLVAGTVFFALRALLALSPRLALARPIRKWAAAGALLAAAIYLALSGGNVATLRAFVMAAVMFTAVLLDRPAISMRNLALAAFIVVAMRPESVLQPGFQMSFGAVAALVAVWEAWRHRAVRQLADTDIAPAGRALRLAGRVFFGIALTTLVAGLATAPFAAFHFERVASYSLLGNLLAAPFVSTVIMPFGLLSLVGMPFGLEAWPLTVMAWGIDALLAIAAWVAALPGAEARAPPIAPIALLMIVTGLLWLCLWRLKWRLLGLPLIGLGLFLIPVLVDRPDIMVAPDGKTVAVRDHGGVLRVSGSRSGSYAIDQFFDKEAMDPPVGDALRKGMRCDPFACLLDAVGGMRVAHVLDPVAFAEDCARADIVVTPLVAPTSCAALVVDARDLSRYGAHAIWIAEDDGAPTLSLARSRGDAPRPWQKGGGPAAE